MNELQAIVDAADSTAGRCILVTVVDVDGSAYRRPGARMLILPSGDHVGMISGGCLERDLCRQASILCQAGPQLISFDTRSESTSLNARYNLGCSGIIYLLVEPVTGTPDCPLRVIRDVLTNKNPAVVGTVYQSDGSERFQVGDRFSSEELSPTSDEGSPVNAFEQVAATGTPVCCQLISGATDTHESVVRVLVEKISPPRPFWLFGAGDDAIPMANIASELGWSVHVIDDRAANLTANRFPQATLLYGCNLNELQEQLVPTADTAAVLMTHSFRKDALLLPWLCQAGLSYLGLLGPKSRTGKLLKRMHEAGTLPGVEHFDRLKTPVGLDIGATNPAQIAISIAAEIVALDQGRSGRTLSQRSEPIHDPVAHQLIQTQTQPARDRVESR